MVVGDWYRVWCWALAGIFMSGESFSITYVRPMPSIPKLEKLEKAVDVFSLNIVSNTHLGLFQINEENLPIPAVVDKYVISSDRKIWRFTLKEIRFHDGESLKIGHVKSSLEYLVENKIQGFDRLSSIVGFDSFLNRKAKDIKGIKLIDDNSGIIEIQLKVPDPDLPSKLGDPVFSIIKEGNLKVGLSDWKIESTAADKISLVNQKDLNRKIVFKEVGKEEVVPLFNSGIVHDLFYYEVNPNEIKTGLASKYESRSHRTIFMALNPTRLNLDRRKQIIKSLRKAEIAKCFDTGSVTDSIIPPGFPGFFSRKIVKPEIDKSNLRIDDELQIRLMNGVGRENCVSKKITKLLSRDKIASKVLVQDSQRVTLDWADSKIDIMLGYIEADDTFEVLHLFNSSSNLYLGDRKMSISKEVDTLLERYRASESLSKERSIIAESVNKAALGMLTFVPILHPKVFLYINKKFKLKHSKYKAPTYIRLDELLYDKSQ